MQVCLLSIGVNVLICGGIGGGAQTAHRGRNRIMRRSPGNTDQAVESYLKGELVSSGANHDHHHHEEGHSCGSHEEGHSCETAAVADAGCGGSQPQLTGRNVGKTCRTHYRGTFNDGTQFDLRPWRTVEFIYNGRPDDQRI